MRPRRWLWLLVPLAQFTSYSHADCDKKEFAIAIDVGHTLHNPGALSARGVAEFYFNRTLAVRLHGELLERGFTRAFLINERGAEIALRDRTGIAATRGADVFLSIHHDSVQPHYLAAWTYDETERRYSDRFAGYSLFVSNKNEARAQSVALARSIGAEFRRNFFTPTLHHAEKIKGENRPLLDEYLGIYRFDELVVLKTAKMPAVLVENGVIANRDEEILLRDPVYQRMLVLSLAQGLETYCQRHHRGHRARLNDGPRQKDEAGSKSATVDD